MSPSETSGSPAPGRRSPGEAGRVIFVNRVYWPAAAATAQLLTDLAEGLAARGWPVHVIAAGSEPGPRHGVVIHRTGEGERHGGLLSRTLNYRRFIRRAREKLATLARPGDVVVAMTDPPLLGTAVAGVAAERGAQVIHWIQDIYPEIVTAHVGALAALAGTLAEHQVPAGNIAIIPNWAPRELEAEPAAAAVAGQRAAWGLDGRFVVAYSGNLGRVHEFAAVIDAADRLRSRDEIVFLFVGTGARFDEVRSAARARGLDNIRFLPPAPSGHLAAALAAADVHLVTLKPDFARLVFPSKLAGVLAAGRPVLFVGPPDGEIARLLAREQCGLTVAPAEGARLAGLVAEWQSDPARCQRRGRQARAAGEKHFMFAAALGRWEGLLRRGSPGSG